MSEHSEQAAFVEYVLYTYQHRADFLRALFFAVPNANKRTRWQAAQLQQEGMTRGIADILYLQPRGGHSFLAIEMKDMPRLNEKNGGLTDAQMEFLQTAADIGARVSACYGYDAAVQLFDEYMGFPT